MAKIYYNLINKGLRVIEDVPMTWREATQALINADNAVPQT